MIVNRDTAKYINTMMLDFSSQISDSVGVVRERCKEDEIREYVKPVSHISALIFDVLDMIHSQYPDLKPDEFND